MTPKLKLTELFFNDGTAFVPSEKEQELVNEVVYLFRRTAEARNQNFEYFDGLNLIEYIEDSVRRFSTNIDEREGIEDWQASVHDQITRNKVLGILGRVLEVLPIVSFMPRGESPIQKAKILTDLYHYTEDKSEYDELMIHILLEAIVKGTAIGYEDIEYRTRKVRDVEGIGDAMVVTEKEIKETCIVGQIVPLEEFYPSSVSIRKIKDMPYAFWRKVIPYAQFVKDFGHYKKSQVVQAKMQFGADDETPYYMDYIEAAQPDGTVEVIKFYDKINDQYVIVANGIWLNPLYSEGEAVMPLPWAHKDLPFWEIKYDVFGDFFYGKSLPDRLKTMQDVLNVLTNMLLDQSFLTIFPPLLTAGIDDIEDDYLRPGRRTPVDTQGMPLQNAYQVLQSPTPQGWHQFILQYTRSIMEESSMDKVSQGVAGQGDRTTAYEVRTAAAGVSAMLQLFARFINTGIKRKALLRAPNIIQFGFNKEYPLVINVMQGREDELSAFETFVTEDATIDGRVKGTRIVEVYESEDKLPTRNSLKAREVLNKIEYGKDFEIVAITPEYLRTNFLYDCQLVVNPRSEINKQNEQVMQVEKVKTYLSFFPDLINRQELAAQTMEKFDDKAEELLMQQGQQMPGMMGGEMPGQGMPNDLRGQGMDGDMAQMAQLQSLMTG